MCFSAAASFASGAVLIPAGAYCISAAIRKRPIAWPIAVAPLLFGVQQISEGFVWLGLDHGDPELVRQGSLVFLFFALAFWPFWFSFQSAVMDPRPRARQLFTLLAIASTFWFWVLFYPIITGPETLMTTRIVRDSIFYDITGLAIHSYANKSLLRVLYFLCIALPIVTGPETVGRLPGLCFAASAVFAAVVFHYAFVSVWCFVAAFITLYLCWYFHCIKAESPRVVEGNLTPLVN